MMKAIGTYKLELIRAGKTVQTIQGRNSIVEDGRNRILDIVFGATAKDTFYIGLIENDVGITLADADTMSSHSGWAESTDYDEANRQGWTTGSAASSTITSSSVATFTMNATTTIYGFFVCTNNTKGGTSGILWATAGFVEGTLPVVSADTLKITYTVALANG